MCRNKFGKLKDDEDDGDGANTFLKFPFIIMAKTNVGISLIVGRRQAENNS